MVPFKILYFWHSLCVHKSDNVTLLYMYCTVHYCTLYKFNVCVKWAEILRKFIQYFLHLDGQIALLVCFILSIFYIILFIIYSYLFILYLINISVFILYFYAFIHTCFRVDKEHFSACKNNRAFFNDWKIETFSISFILFF